MNLFACIGIGVAVVFATWFCVRLFARILERIDLD